MLIPTAVMGGIAFALLAIGLAQGKGQAIAGLKAGWEMMLGILPLLVFAFVIAGMIQVLLPQHLVAKWVGGESGMKGIFIGALAGAFAPGGPYVSLPIAIGLIRSGAGAGAMVAFLTGWSLWSVARLPMEVGILGWKLTLIRLVSTLIFPPIAGGIAHMLFGSVKL